MTEYEWQNFLTKEAGEVSKLLVQQQNRERFREQVQAVIKAYKLWRKAIRDSIKEAIKNPNLSNENNPPDDNYLPIDLNNEDIQAIDPGLKLFKQLPAPYIWTRPLPPNPLEVYLPQKTLSQLTPPYHFGVRKPCCEEEALQLKYFFLAVIHANIKTNDQPVLPQLIAVEEAIPIEFYPASLLWFNYGQMSNQKLYHLGTKVEVAIKTALEYVSQDLENQANSGQQNGTETEIPEVENLSIPVKEPPKEAAQAYKLYYSMSTSQAEVAKIMTKELKRSISQGQVSRWVKQQKEWRKSVGLPVEEANPSQIKPIDPSKLDLDKRTDGHRTGDSRFHQDSDD